MEYLFCSLEVEKENVETRLYTLVERRGCVCAR